MLKKLLLCLSFCAVSLYAGVPLTSNGRPDAEIVIDRDSHPAVRYAAEELRRWVREISGAELPIVNTPGGAATKIRLAANRNRDDAETRESRADTFSERFRNDS